ncbi:hypothetical protein A7A76_08520 [Lysobacter enzymogenes]|uniref:hypothetical protein n=1 Tax=Lysobacter enzymogenes TaxID=69 RepID=UPI0019D1A7F0|nr:hypothetical protein [Lysobacter enzymogenes]MBN7134762.1 hypothetical protein [Lysobacter enzymogenes]
MDTARQQFRIVFSAYRVLRRDRYVYGGPNTHRAEVAAKTILAFPFALQRAASDAFLSSFATPDDALLYSLQTRRAFRRVGVAVRL